MKISIDDVELFTLSGIQKKVICDYMSEDILDADLKRRLQWVLMHLYEEAFKNVKERWEPILKERHDMIPTDPNVLAQLIFSQPDYKCRKQRENS